MKSRNSQPALYFECLRDSPLPSVAPTLMGVYNMAYLATADASAQISLRETSDMPKTLDDIAGKI
jgi:hypothetical protein